MITSNYHIHSNYCDGANTLGEMARAAREAGLTSIGFSSHFALDYDDDYAIDPERIDEYLNEVEELKRLYSGEMEIFKGFEVDYYMHYGDISGLAKKTRPQLDYIIGSIHTMGFLEDGEMAVIDYLPDSFRKGVYEIYGTAEDFIKAYYTAIGDMAERVRPDIIGHIDLIKKNNFGVYNEEAPYYKGAVFEALERIKGAGSILEVNTGGMQRYGDRCLYPSRFILEEARKMGIPITLNGDSHSTAAINYAYDRMEGFLVESGVREIMRLTRDGWVESPV